MNSTSVPTNPLASGHLVGRIISGNIFANSTVAGKHRYLTSTPGAVQAPMSEVAVDSAGVIFLPGQLG